jgi:hypothetical protein
MESYLKITNIQLSTINQVTKISDLHKSSKLKEIIITDRVTIRKVKNFSNLEAKGFVKFYLKKALKT